MRKLTTPKKILILILLVAAGLRLWNLGAADVITDEALNGFRSIGKIDFFVSEFQKTPYDWYGAGDIPGWAKLSYHDHPPLTFIIQNIFFKIGGINLWALRLPFALAGIASVYLIYLIGRILFGLENWQLLNKSNMSDKANRSDMSNMSDRGGIGGLVGLAAAGLLAINSYHVWISRIGLMESIVIFLNLLTVYFFLKGVTTSLSAPRAAKSHLHKGGKREIQEKKYLILTGLAFGLSLLAKYTSIVLLPIFVLYLFSSKKTFRLSSMASL